MAERVRLVWEPTYRETVQQLSEPPLDRAAEVVLEGMKRLIPTSAEGSNGRQPGYARSRLRVLRALRDAAGPLRDVGTDATAPGGYSYPLGLEYGTKPHEIRSHGKYPLRDRHGRVFGPVVQHPGTTAQPWARPALAELAGRKL